MRLFSRAEGILRDNIMRHLQFGYVVAVLAVSTFAAPSIRAQYYQPRPGGGYPGGLGGVPGYGTPTVSPYVGLVQRGVSPAIAYYGFVRPTINLQNQTLGLQQQLAQTNAQVAATDQLALGIPETGHNIYFMNTSHYFGSLSSPVRGMATGATNQTSSGGSTSTSGSGGGGASASRGRVSH
jgi:hypothetical protein